MPIAWSLYSREPTRQPSYSYIVSEVSEGIGPPALCQTHLGGSLEHTERRAHLEVIRVVSAREQPLAG